MESKQMKKINLIDNIHHFEITKKKFAKLINLKIVRLNIQVHTFAIRKLKEKA